MINYIRIELDRAFRNKKMAMAIFIGCMISILQIAFEVIPVLKYQDYSDFKSFPHTSFEHYMGLKNGSMFGLYYYLLIPILAAFPYAVTAYTDKKTGYLKSIFTRIGKKEYYVAKYVVTFLSGGVIAVLPQVINFMGVSVLLPSIQPYTGLGYVGLLPEAMWGKLFYSNAIIYIVLYWIFDFILYGLINTLAVAVMWFIQNQFVLLLFPFLYVKGMDLFMEVIHQPGLIPSVFLRPNQAYTSEHMVLGRSMFIVGLLGIDIISGIYGIWKKDNI